MNSQFEEAWRNYVDMETLARERDDHGRDDRLPYLSAPTGQLRLVQPHAGSPRSGVLRPLRIMGRNITAHAR